MASPQVSAPSEFELAHFERLAEVSDLASLARTPGWKKLCAYMDGLVDEALSDVRGCLASNETKGLLATRWQQREAVVKAVKSFVEDHVSEQEFLVKEAQSYEHDTADTESGS